MTTLSLLSLFILLAPISTFAQATAVQDQRGAVDVIAAPVTPGVGRVVPLPSAGDRGTAKALVLAGNPVAAEKLLTDQNRFRANTREGSLESARKVIGLADELARDGKATATAPLVSSALQHLQQALDRASTNRSRSKVRMTTGFVHERFRGDPAAALAQYQSALQLDPNNASAREAVERLKDADEKLKARIRARRR